MGQMLGDSVGGTFPGKPKPTFLMINLTESPNLSLTQEDEAARAPSVRYGPPIEPFIDYLELWAPAMTSLSAGPCGTLDSPGPWPPEATVPMDHMLPRGPRSGKRV